MLGRTIDTVTGITGVAADANGGGTLPTKRRFHSLKAHCVAVNYTGGVALATKKITGAGNDACTSTPTIVNGQVTAAAVVAAGAGYVTGDTITLVDATGTGCVLTVTAAAGAVTALAVTSGGTQSPVSALSMFSAMALRVNDVPFRAVSLSTLMMLAQVRGVYPALGELPFIFTEPDMNLLNINDATSWDLLGGEKFEMQFKLKSTIVNPGLTLDQEFDLIVNAQRNAKGKVQRFRNPTKYRETTINLNVGENPFNETTLNTTAKEPIRRMYILGETPGNITDLQVTADSSVKLKASVKSILRHYEELGFHFGRANFLNSGYATSNALKAQFEKPVYFDAAFIADVDRRLGEALVYTNDLQVVIKSAVAQKATVVFETSPGNWK